MSNMKKGVSLVTVLLFMLVATIAATATYKWLNSQGLTSGSRMAQSEARQSAIAGLEAARSWMTNHGNETGAVLKQYLGNSSRNPVVLDDQLFAMEGGKQNYSVAVVGADVSEAPYKVKVISKGTSRDGAAAHTEVAILKVNGLYKVNLPKAPGKAVNFKANYFGGSTASGTNTYAESMIVNGDLTGSQIHVTKDLVVTGNLANDGTNFMELGDRTCVGGDLLSAGEALSKAASIYVHGDAPKIMVKTGSITGDAYFNGDVSLAENGNGGLIVDGGMTVNGTITKPTGKTIYVKQNLCLGTNGKIKIDGASNSTFFKADGDIWIPSVDALQTERVQGAYSHLVLGNSAASKVYVQGMKKCSDEGYKSYKINGSEWRQDYSGNWYDASEHNLDLYENTGYGWETCPGDFYYQRRGSLQSGYGWHWATDYGMFKSLSTHRFSSVTGTQAVECDGGTGGIRDYCESALGASKEGCASGSGKASYKVADILTTGQAEFSKDKYVSQCVKDVFSNPGTGSGVDDFRKSQGVAEFNKCFANASTSDLFNGFLVIKAKADVLNTFFVNSTTPFVGKFIIYVDEPEGTGGTKLSGKLPATSGDASFVFLYLPNGAGTLTPVGSKFNWFIYSEYDIEEIGNSSGVAWQGSLYARADHCAKASKFNDKANLTYNEALITALSASHIICNAGTTGCGTGATTSTETSSGSESSSGSEDSDFVAVAPQLNIELETQYKSDEDFACPSGATCDVQPSMVVLPRIVYMTTNPVGKLSDYYNVVGLNGGTPAGTATPICITEGTTFPSCVGAPPGTGKIYSGTGDGLPGGFYKYKYVETVGGTSQTAYFYVKVQGETGSTPSVSFAALTDETSGVVDINSTASSDHILSLVLSDASNVSGTFSVDIQMTTPPDDKWVVTTPSGGAITWKNGNVYTYTGTITSDPIPLFKIHTDVGARSGSLTFSLRSDPLVNCILGNSRAKTFSITGYTTVHLGTIEEYCADDKLKVNCEGDGEKYANAAGKPNYDGDEEWIVADGCTVLEKNARWKCVSGYAINLRGTGIDSKYYTLYLPEVGNQIPVPYADNTEGVPDGGYKLYASLKKKQFTVSVDMPSGKNTQVRIYSKSSLDAAWPTEADENCESGTCSKTYTVDTHVRLVAEKGTDETFNYWTCTGNGSNCIAGKKYTSSTIDLTMDADYSFTPHINEHDQHCFYTDFGTVPKTGSDNSGYTAEWCSDDNTIDCIDYCKSGTSCSVTDSRYANSGWMLIKANDGSSFKKLSLTNRLSSNTYLQYDGDGDASKTSFILSTAQSGANGVYTTRIKTGITCNVHQVGCLAYVDRHEYMLNSGYVLRSNASGTEYIQVSVYATAYTGFVVAGGVAEQTYARACYFKDNARKHCDEQEIRVKNTNGIFPYEVLLPLNIVFTLNGNELILDATYSKSAELVEGRATFDLKNVVNDGDNVLNNPTTYAYVGVKLADDKFRVGDLSWHSLESGVECFADPSASCSFAANYLGGLVPGGEDVDEDVYPWVGMSSWFADKLSNRDQNNCTVKYYYNGCDLPGSYYKIGSLPAALSNAVTCGGIPIDPGANGHYKNYIGDDGLRVNDDGKFKFTYEGAHGYAYDGGIVRNASVVVDCRSVNGHKYETNCGEFYVGKRTPCDKNTIVFTGTQSLPANTDGIEFKLQPTGTIANMRDATIMVQFADLPSDAKLKIQLCDESEKCSAIKTFGGSIDVNTMLEGATFNPEKVTSVRLQSSVDVVVTSIMSGCPNAVKVSCNSAAYSGGMWTINATVSNTSGSKKCLVVGNYTPVGDDFNTTGVVACNMSTGTYQLKDQYFMDRLNGGSGGVPTFTVKVFDEEDATETSVPADICTVSNSGYKPVSVACSFPNQSNGLKVIEGNALPRLTYNIENCPSDSYCGFEAYVMNGSTEVMKLNTAGKSLSGSWTPGVLETNNGYYFRVKAIKNDDLKTVLGSCNTPTFDVTASVDASATCSLNSDDKKFEYTLSGVSSLNGVGGQLLVTDQLGNTIGSLSLDTKLEGASIDLSGITGNQNVLLTFYIGKNTPCGEGVLYNPTGTIAVDELAIASCPTGPYSGTSADIDMTVTGCGLGMNCTWSIDNGASVSYSNGKIHITNAEEGKSYNVTVSRTINGESPSVSCNGISFAPTLACTWKKGGEEFESLYLGESFIFSSGTTVGCQNAVLTGDNLNVVGCVDSHEITPQKIGKLTYTYTVSDDLSCTKEVTVTNNCSKYCSSGCDNLQSGNLEANPNASVKCFFVSSVSEMNGNYSQNKFKVNGTEIGYCGQYSPSCASALADVDKVDGGYYIEVPVTTGCKNPNRNNENCEWIQIITSGVPGNLCSGSCTYTKGMADIERSDNMGSDGNGLATYTVKVGETISLDKQTDVIRIGTWDGKTHKVQVQDCNGNISEKTINSGAWNDLGVSDKCTIYVKVTENDLNMKFGVWN